MHGTRPVVALQTDHGTQPSGAAQADGWLNGLIFEHASRAHVPASHDRCACGLRFGFHRYSLSG
jgi:hypothetical protein